MRDDSVGGEEVRILPGTIVILRGVVGPIVALVFIGLVAPSARAIEIDVDRPGLDYRNFDLSQAQPFQCEKACSADGRCRAWTYVKPGVQGAKARCWLKSAVPQAHTHPCCHSGVKGDSAATAEIREIQSLLATLGYDPGPIDGKPGRQTTAAIRQFQSEHQMSADGQISPLLIRGLNGVWFSRNEQARGAGGTVAPAPAPAAPSAPLPSARTVAPEAPTKDLSDLDTLD